jgi:formylglycine-generating enzyme
MKHPCGILLVFTIVFVLFACSKKSTEPSDTGHAQMVRVPAGNIIMGDTNGIGIAGATAHHVNLSSFYIGRHEVTQAEWMAVMGTDQNPSCYSGDDQRPVEQVSWYMTLIFCNKKSLSEGRTPVYSINGSTNPDEWNAVPHAPDWDAANCNWSANGYRLPTEAEWEYAARSASSNPDYLYSGSNEIDTVAWYSDNSDEITHPIANKTHNALSLYDMTGNVWEWCWDWFSASYYNSGPVDNPTGPGVSPYSCRLFRGGSYNSPIFQSYICYRGNNTPNLTGPDIGFRIATSY